MKTIIKILLILLLSVKNLFALFGAGDIVSDPTSYTYYAKEIKALNDQLKTALDQLEVLNKANDLIDDTNNLLFNAGERIYNPTKQIQNLLRNIERTKERFQNTAERASNMGIERLFKDYHNIDAPLETKAYEKWKNNLSALFNNSEDEKYQELRQQILNAQKNKNYLKYQQAVNNMTEYLKLKKIEQEAVKKASLRAPIELYQEYFLSEKAVRERDMKMQDIDILNSQIHNEKDLMKQQQTTNQILILILETLQNQYDMQMRFYYAMSIPAFSDQSTSIEHELKEIKKEREEFYNAERVEQSPARKETKRYLRELAKKGEQSEIYEILSGKRNFHEY